MKPKYGLTAIFKIHVVFDKKCVMETKNNNMALEIVYMYIERYVGKIVCVVHSLLLINKCSCRFNRVYYVHSLEMVVKALNHSASIPPNAHIQTHQYTL